MSETHADHFESLAVQEHAAKLGMWIFLCSEILLFAGLFALYGASRAHDPLGFRLGVQASARNLGSLNTAVLLVSSTTAALGVAKLRAGKSTVALRLILATIALGVLFLTIKGFEYSAHFREGILPGGQGAYFAEHAASPTYWTLYYVMTGLHALHVLVGVSLLSWTALRMRKGLILSSNSYHLDVIAMYWHLIDVIWIFLWPLIYLA